MSAPTPDTTPHLLLAPAGDTDARFFRIELNTTLIQQLDDLQAVLDSAPKRADVTSINALARTDARLVSRYQSSTHNDTDEAQRIHERLTGIELDTDPWTGEAGAYGMRLVPPEEYPDPEGVFDTRNLVYARLYAGGGGDVTFHTYWGEDELVESWSINPARLRELTTGEPVT